MEQSSSYTPDFQSQFVGIALIQEYHPHVILHY